MILTVCPNPSIDCTVELGSLDVGKVNRIENKKAFPSMQLFFDICEYLHVTPGQFIDRGGVPAEISEELKELFVLMQKLTPGQREIIRSVAEEFLAAGSAKEPSEAVR